MALLPQPTQLATLGALGRLPPEVRIMIWKLLPLQHHKSLASLSTSEQTRPAKHKLAILQTSHFLNAEASPYLYGNQVLRFRLANWNRWRSWLQISTSNGSEWEVKSLKDAIEQGFHKLPYRKLKRIEVVIGAPSWQDRGQLLYLWSRATELVELLEHADGLPDLHIQLSLCSGRQRWLLDGTLGRRLDIRGRNADTGVRYHDHEVVILPFCRLRGVKSLKINFIEPIQKVDLDHFDKFVAQVRTVMTRKELFGEFKDTVEWNDSNIQKMLDVLWMVSDFAIDHMQDRPARLLRIERFASWYSEGLGSESKYVNKLERLYQDNPRHVGRAGDLRVILARYNATRTWNPLSLGMQKNKLMGELVNKFEEVDLGWPKHVVQLTRQKSFQKWIVKAVYSEANIEEGWDEEEWFRLYRIESGPSIDWRRYGYRACCYRAYGLRCRPRFVEPWNAKDEDSIKFRARFDKLPANLKDYSSYSIRNKVLRGEWVHLLGSCDDDSEELAAMKKAIGQWYRENSSSDELEDDAPKGDDAYEYGSCSIQGYDSED